MTVLLWQPVLRFLASQSDPSGLDRAETFWNFLSHGLRPWCLGQFQLSFSVKPRWVPRSFSEVRLGPTATHYYGIAKVWSRRRNIEEQQHGFMPSWAYCC
jgi:hypothetical protein